MQSNVSALQQVARRYWGMSLIRGIVLIIFGLVTIFWPHLTFFLFMLTFGIFALIEGIVLISSAFTQRTVSAPTYTRPVEGAQPGEVGTRERFAYGAQSQPQPVPQVQPETAHKTSRGVLVVEGILSIICGILALVLPGIVGAVALYVVAAWALFAGLGALMQMRVHGWVLGLVGILGVILFLIVIFNPLRIIQAAFWIIGVFALIAGIMLVVRALQHNAATRVARPIEPSY